MCHSDWRSSSCRKSQIKMVSLRSSLRSNISTYGRSTVDFFTFLESPKSPLKIVSLYPCIYNICNINIYICIYKIKQIFKHKIINHTITSSPSYICNISYCNCIVNINFNNETMIAGSLPNFGPSFEQYVSDLKREAEQSS